MHGFSKDKEMYLGVAVGLDVVLLSLITVSYLALVCSSEGCLAYNTNTEAVEAHLGV